jgi:hypothetical protein
VTKVDIVQVPIAAAEAVALPASPKPKKAKAKKEPEPVVANAAAGSASAAEPEKKKAPAKAKKEKSEAQNLDKLNPTQKKVLKKEEVDPKTFLEFVNALSEEEYRAKTFEEHVQNFGKPKEEIVDKELVDVSFNGKVYCIDPKTNKVYVEDGEVAKLVGHVGMMEFVGMVVPA